MFLIYLFLFFFPPYFFLSSRWTLKSFRYFFFYFGPHTQIHFYSQPFVHTNTFICYTFSCYYNWNIAPVNVKTTTSNKQKKKNYPLKWFCTYHFMQVALELRNNWIFCDWTKTKGKRNNNMQRNRNSRKEMGGNGVVSNRLGAFMITLVIGWNFVISYGFIIWIFLSNSSHILFRIFSFALIFFGLLFCKLSGFHPST